ncbi:MAG TPA: hypothetical protein VGJ05_22045 [Fimbriiglobus sp.]|jgi:hypothetical protein
MPNSADREPDDVPPEDADLIAYLDGEADPDAARRLETELAKNPAARTKAEALRKTYDLLDYLPKPEPSPTFATKTLTKLDAMSGSRPRIQTTLSQPPSAARLGPWIAAGLLAVAFGFGVHWIARPYLNRPGEPDLADLPIIDRLPLYAGIDDLDYAKQLAAADLFGEDFEPPDAVAPEPAVSPEQRADRIALFRGYPAARRQQLRTLHQDITALPQPEQGRLVRVLERYAGWLARVPEKMRKEVLDAPSADARLAAVRQVRNRQWEEALPATQREKLQLTANADERIRLVKEWRDKERDRQLEWHLAARQWAVISEGKKPWPFSDETLAKDVDAYVKAVFKPDAPAAKQRLFPTEVNKLKTLQAATGQNAAWLPYGAYILLLSERYPTLPVPPFDPTVTDLDQLSARTTAELKSKNGVLKPKYRFVIGKWPDFALAVARDVKAPKPAAGNRSLGPCKPGDFAAPVNDFLTHDLFPRLTSNETRKLDQLAGRWPEYPRQLMELAKAKDLSVPGVTLPGRPSLWAKYYRYTPTKGSARPGEKD